MNQLPQQHRDTIYYYVLSVVQQPQRARMCGFGDKDRRPITPPPCVRLFVYDSITRKEIDPADMDGTFFVLTVDLWDANADREVNLVRHTSNTSINSSNTTAWPPPVERTTMYMPHPLPAVDPYGRPVPPPPAPGYPNTVPGYNYVASSQHYPYPSPAYAASTIAVATPAASTAGMFTRNLIGQTTVNACKLNDTEGKPGFWFVLQDLSVRTEGTFRLKMNFVDVGNPANNSKLNLGRAPVLATCFSEQFNVYSAKKFPGVIDSTPLSKAFAHQGIKIPIRKPDSAKRRRASHNASGDDSDAS